ncbi:MAG: Zn-dependent alcohol dehydrogenase [Candidatus Poribacteria bacterium]|nr:MAG: Zn-dependent alcohol dehydrogenase [Candidatus Poribacteria bacterium]
MPIYGAYYAGSRTVYVDRSDPIPPGPGEVRLQVAYCGVCGTDLHVYQGHMDRRIAAPQVIGHEMAGTVVEVGPDVSGWEPGDRVVVRPVDPCDNCPACRAGHRHLCHRLKVLGIDTPGAFQGSWTVPAHTLHRLPEGLSLEEAALVEPVAVACHDVRLAAVAPGETVVVIGGGPIGALNALVARHVGGNVLVAEINPYRLRLLRSLGLEAVDPRQVDLTELVQERTAGAGADVVFEVSGSAAGARLMTELPRVRGRMIVVAIFSEPPSVDLFRVFWRELQLRGTRLYEPEDFEQAIQLLAERALPVQELITDRRPLSALPQVFEELTAGADAMKVLIDVQQV